MRFFEVMFFLWTGFGYGLAGVLHQVFHEAFQNEEHHDLWKLSYISTILGIIALNIMGNWWLSCRWDASSRIIDLVLDGVALVLGFVMIVWILVDTSLLA